MTLHNYNEKSVNVFVEGLIHNKVILPFKDGYILSTPFEIELPAMIARKLTASYKNNEETGGLLLARVVTGKGGTKLLIDNWQEIENKVEEYYPTYSKKNSYLADQNIYQKVLEENFSKVANEILFPIHYHTHPTIELENNAEFLSSFSKLDLSDADINASESRSLRLGKYNLYYVNSILTGKVLIGNFRENRILFYGKGISPTNFKGVRKHQGVNAIYETISEQESGLDKFLATAGFALWELGALAMASNNKPHMAKDMRDGLADLVKNKEYFSTISDYIPTVVKIPIFRIDENS